LTIIAPLAVERRSFRGLAGPFEILQSGPGYDAAARAARAAVQRGAGALLSFGVAGGLDPDIRSGTAVVPLVVIGSDGREWPVSKSWQAAIFADLRESLSVSEAAVYSPSDLLMRSGDKIEAGLRHGAAACDMESAAIAKVADDAGIEFAVVRVIADEADDNLPSSVGQWVDEGGNDRYLEGMIASLNPTQWKPLLVIALRFRRASRTLEHIARKLAPSGFSRGIVRF